MTVKKITLVAYSCPDRKFRERSRDTTDCCHPRSRPSRCRCIVMCFSTPSAFDSLITGKLSVAQPLIAKIKLVDALQPANGSVFDYCAALVRKNADGTGAIVYGSTTTSILKTLLVEAAKKQAEAEKATEDNSKLAQEARESIPRSRCLLPLSMVRSSWFPRKRGADSAT